MALLLPARRRPSGGEVLGGAEAMLAAGLPAPKWFRGSTAKYDLSAIRQIRGMGYRIAG